VVLFTEIFAGQLIEGGCASVTVTVKEQVAVWPLEAVTVYTFVVVPTGKLAPEAEPDVCAVLTPEQLSVPTGAVYVTVALQSPVVFVVEILAGQVILGGCASVTVTMALQVAVLP
jgi:hypothetical protein